MMTNRIFSSALSSTRRRLGSRVAALLVLAPLGGAMAGVPISTAFTYQGNLTADGQPADGLYDFQFSLWDAASGGNSVAGPLSTNGMGVTGGLFTVPLDFGSGVFGGQAMWLQISVRTNGDGGFTALTPLQPLTASPFALYALNSATSSSLSGVIIATNPANQFEGTFIGNAAGLTNLNLGTAQGGSLPVAALPPAAQLILTNTIYSPWQPSTRYEQGQVVMGASNSLWIAWTQNGTSGTSVPTGHAAVTDGTVTWYPYGSHYPSASPTYYPTVGVGGLPAALSNGNWYVYSPLPDDTGTVNSTNWCSVQGGPMEFVISGWYTVYRNLVLSSPTATAVAGSGNSFTNQNIYAAWGGAGCRVTFMTDAPLLSLGPMWHWGQQAQYGNITVDGETVSDNGIDSPSTTAQGAWITLDFHGLRKTRTIAFYYDDLASFYGLWVDKLSSVWPPPALPLLYVEGCSLEQGGNNTPLEPGNEWPSILGRNLGYAVQNGAVGGTGLTNFAGKWVTNTITGTGIPDTYLARVPLIIAAKPNLIIMSGDVNDANTQSSNSMFMAQTQWVASVRAGLPTTPIVVLGLVEPAWNGAAQFAVMLGAMRNAVSYMNDPNLYFVSSASWFNGNGNVAAPTGNGNSDIYGSSDGVHPTDWGNQYIAQQVANALRGLFPTVPPPIRDTTPARGGTAVAGCGFPMQTTAPTAAQIGGVVGSVTNHLMVNVGGALIDYWSDGTTLYSRRLAP